MNIYKTDRITLIPFNKLFIGKLSQHSTIKSNYYDWFSDPEVTKLNSHGVFKEDYEGFFNSIEREKVICYAIIHKDHNLHIGNVSLQEINWVNRSAEFAVVIGEKEYYGKGFAFEALKILIDHGFSKMNLNRIWAKTSEKNIGMNRVAKKLNMFKEGVEVNGIFHEGRYSNVNCYSILQNQWLTNKFYEEKVDE